MYKILWDKGALEDLYTIDKNAAIKLVKKVEEYLRKDPVNLGKPLTGQFKGLYRYRVGNYRVIYEINQQDIVIIVIRIGNRKEAYQ